MIDWIKTVVIGICSGSKRLLRMFHTDINLSGVWLPYFSIILTFVSSCSIGHLLPAVIVCHVSWDKGIMVD